MSSPVSSMVLLPSATETNSSIHGSTVLVEGKLLSGNALLEYAQQKGLCSKCVQHVTHKRARKRLGMLRYAAEWVPLTMKDDQEGNFTVYKGYCLQPTCWTLQEVQVILGERPMHRSLSRGKARTTTTPTRTRDPNDGRPPSRSRDGSPAVERSPGSLQSRSPGSQHSRGSPATRSPGSQHSRQYGPVVECQQNLGDSNHSRDTMHGSGAQRVIARRRVSVSHGPRTPSTRNLVATSRSADRMVTSSRNLDDLSNSDTLPFAIPTNATPLSVEARRQQTQRHESDPTLQLQRSRRQVKTSGSMDADRRVMRVSVPDVDVLQQLCRMLLEKATPSRGLGSASDAALWSSLLKRYGDESTAVETRSGKIATLLQLLARTEDLACLEPTWALLSFITKQDPQGEQQEDRIVRNILVEVSGVFDRGDSFSSSKKLAARTLHNMLKADEHSYDSKVLGALQLVSSSRRQQWIAVLLDTLMFQDEEDHELSGNSDGGITEILYVVWNLLLLQPVANDETGDTTEVGMLMQTIIGIALSILSSEITVYGGVSDRGGHKRVGSSNEAQSSGSFRLSETALGLLATGASRGGAIALAGRQYECISIVRETIERHSEPDVMIQGALATRFIISCYDWHGKDSVVETIEGEDRQAKPSVLLAELVIQVVTTILSCGNLAAPELSASACRLLTLLIESDDEIRRLVAESELLLGVTVVQSLVEVLECASDVGVAESACDILLILVSKCHSTGRHLRYTHEIAFKLVHWMEKYHESPFVQEHLCLIVEHLIASEDHQFGQEIGAAGGLKIIGDLLLLSAREGTFIEAASRALVGVLTGVHREELHAHQAALTEAVVLTMRANERELEVQLAAIDVLHCLCIRPDCLKDHFGITVPVLVESMENHLGSVYVLMRCCSVIRIVAVMIADWTVFAETGAVRMIINAMLIHPASSEFVMEGMATLKDLAAKESFREHFDPSDAEAAVVSLFEANSDNAEVLALAFATLNNIAVDSRSRTVAPMQHVVLSTIISAMKTFPTNENLLENAFLLMKSYTYAQGNVELMRARSDTLIPILVGLPYGDTGARSERAEYIMGKLSIDAGI